MPKTTAGFRRTPGDLKLKIDAPNLQELTAFLPTPVTGSLQATGTIKTDNSIARLELTARGNLIGYDKAAVNTLSAKISATKKLPATDATEEPFYANLDSSVQAELSDVRYDQFVIDSVRAQITSKDAKVSFEPVSVQRRNNLLLVRGNYQLPPPNGKVASSSRPICSSVSALRNWLITGRTTRRERSPASCRPTATSRIRGGVASGQINLSGQEIAAQKLVVKQLSMQTAIANNIVYLNDLTATLNDKDYVNAHGTVKLEKPFAYTGVATANLADLSTFEPLLSWRFGGRAGVSDPGYRRGREEDAACWFVSRELERAGRGRHFQEQRRPQP